MSCDHTSIIISLVEGKLDIKAAFARVAVPIHSPEQLSGLACEHRTNDHLKTASKRLNEVLGCFKFLFQRYLIIVKNIVY